MQLAVIIMLFVVVAAPGAAWGAGLKAPHPRGDGKIALFNYHEGEYAEITYRKGKRYIPSALRKISHLFRSRGDGKEHRIDTRLIELLDHIQDHFGAETVEIISGYRSPAYNRSLMFKGRGAASESLHTQGLAADIHLDEIREEDLFKYASSLSAGGVGLYPTYAFVHVDVGPQRRWQDPAPKHRILVGTDNNPNLSWTAITDQNIYRRGDTLKLGISNNSYGPQWLTKNIWTERFCKGRWGEQKKVKKGRAIKLKPGQNARWKWKIPQDQPYGKYRLVIFASRDFSIPPAYSNEFYIKKPVGKEQVQ